MLKVAFVSQDGLSTVIFARWYAQILRDRSDIAFYTISSRDLYDQELRELGSRHIDVSTVRFVNPLRDAAYCLRLFLTFRRERFDVVVTFGTKPNIYGPVAARLAGVSRIVLAVRGLGRTFSDQDSWRKRVLGWVMHRLYWLSCHCAHRVWFTSAIDRDYMVAKGLVVRSRTFLTTNSVNPDFFSMAHVSQGQLEKARSDLGVSADSCVVVMVARMLWTKGIAEYVEAARLLRGRYPTTKFVLVAPLEGSSMDSVPRSYLATLEAANVIWVEFQKDVRSLYAVADIAVLPSYYKEGGYPRALLEPMALGKPVIAADTPECRGPIEPDGNGFLVPPRDAVALSDRIETLIQDPVLRRRFGCRSREIVLERFADGIVGKQVLAEIGIEP